VKVDFPPSKLKSGSGEFVCFVLDHLAEEALKRKGFSFRRYSHTSPLLTPLTFSTPSSLTERAIRFLKYSSWK